MLLVHITEKPGGGPASGKMQVLRGAQICLSLSSFLCVTSSLDRLFSHSGHQQLWLLSYRLAISVERKLCLESQN